MSFNSGPIIHQLHRDFQELIEYVTGEGSRSRTAYEVELTLFRKLLALGALLLRLFFAHRASVRPRGPVYAPDRTELKYVDMRPTTYFSVFGKIRFRRHYFHAPGQKGVCPLDAELSLPPRCYSDLLRDWVEHSATNESYTESLRTPKRILGLSISKQALETGIQEDAIDVEAFYEQKEMPPAELEGSILVVQADGKGVPMKRDEPAVKTARRGKGQKRTKKKEAVVTAIYTIEPYWRTAQEIVDTLVPEQEQEEPEPKPHSQRPTPVGKEVRATLEGKDVAFERLTQRVAQREDRHFQHRVALTDGSEPLQDRMLEQLPQFTLVLDIIHASEYLWAAANALLGETNPERTAWVRERLLHILCGQTAMVIQDLENQMTNPSLSPTQREALKTTIGYYRRNSPYMRYDQYLNNGWPIGTGVVEGACGHLVKDRMEQSGMRWTKQGAQSLLDLRAVRINDDWDAYQRFHRQRQHQRLYGPCATILSIPERRV
ncbi:MAG: ISKra4 family transposase, partial [Anaerolineales bacterium]|nr:ISKra4 family transposase [Anaerolineales bacterium]